MCIRDRNNGILADVATTIISILGLEKPAEMDGKILIAE
jgi:bisphosphoglycerate-independent phosphoglycerate mutase (AlkP superfamily)